MRRSLYLSPSILALSLAMSLAPAGAPAAERVVLLEMFTNTG